MKNPAFIRFSATFGGIGYFPAAAGTLASVAGTGIALLLVRHPLWYLAVWLVVTVAGFWAAGPMEKLTRQKDPSCIVIDEVSGILLALFLLPMNVPVILTAFFLFRAFDMFKIYPVNKFEALEGSWGVMMDDLIAGLYTNLTMQVAVRWSGII